MPLDSNSHRAGRNHAERVAMRSPDQVMRLTRLGAHHATRLSFLRAMLRRVADEGWRCTRPLWRIDEKGVGVAVYEAAGPNHVYSLVAFGHDLPPDKRTDRVIAEAWDATFTLFDGRPTEADLARLAANVPKQEAGRVSQKEIVLLRANRSVRLFEHVIATLAEGRQPEAAELDRVGYLMRTTAVYGGGKFGLSDRERIAGRPELAGPFRAEMLAVWLARAFTTDLVEHLARVRNPGKAVPFDRDLRRHLGVGNSTGLGMAPFVVNHPTLFARWIEARERALARVRSERRTTPAIAGRFREIFQRARAYAASWRVEDQGYTKRIARLERDLDGIAPLIDGELLDGPEPWDALYRHAEAHCDLDAQELVVTLLLEPNGALVDDLADQMVSEESGYFTIDGSMSTAALRTQIERDYAWALGTDYADPASQARFWYTSVEKLEPRLGERFEEDGAELEQPLAVARDVARLWGALAGEAAEAPIARFLAVHPEHRHAVRRVQAAAHHPYQEIRDNIIDARMSPNDILRCKLAFFGAQRFDPKSDRWLRISLFPYAPFPDELDTTNADDWAFPPLPTPVRPTITVSLNEIDAMAKKATRGAGHAWGIAEEAGRAARWLESRGLPGLAALLGCLESGETARSALVAGASLADRAQEIAAGRSLTVTAVTSPLLVLPFAAAAAHMARCDAELVWPGGRLRLANGLALLAGRETVLAEGPVDLTLRPATGAADDAGLVERIGGVIVDLELWRALDRLAAKTYVPASQTSRQRAGAGGGMQNIDND
jgi:hypothetical protein